MQDNAHAVRRAALDWREAAVGLVVLLGAFTTLASEGLGLVHALDRSHLLIAWTLFAVALGALGWRQHWIARLQPSRPREWTGQPAIWLAVALAYALILLVVALAAPPNTNDSLQYHMSRVAHWAQQASLAHYATPISRQLWMPPFAEIAVLNLYVLAGGDRLVNLVQWMSMAFGVLAVSRIAAGLGAKPKGQAFAALFAATVPMGILQATSTQNDYVTALWVVCLAHYALKAHQARLTLAEWGLAAGAVGLGTLTKGTFPGFALPLLVWMGVSAVRRSGWRATARIALLGLVIVLLLNAGAWTRNLRAYGTPLGPVEGITGHGNTLYSWRAVASNMIRNATLHLATPYGDVNGPIKDAVTAVHNWMGLDVNDPRTTMGEYRVKRSFHEDFAGNPYHFVLIWTSLVGLVCLTARRSTRAEDGSMRAAAVYALVVVAQYAAFALLYKWQATGSRLLLAFFLASAPAAGVALERLHAVASPRRLGPAAANGIALLLVLTSLRPLWMNPSRPLIPRPGDGISLANTSRQEMLFINTPELMPGYMPLIEAASRIECSALGLKIDSSHPEYPFWALLAPPGSGVRLDHIEVDPPLGGYLSPFKPCAILCTYCTDASLAGMPLLFNQAGAYSLYVSSPAP